MAERRAYIESLDASGGHVLALFGLLSRIRQAATGALPTRAEWITALEAHMRSKKRDGKALEILNAYFPIAGEKPRHLKIKSYSIETLVGFVEACLRGETPMFKGEAIGVLLARVGQKGGLLRMIDERKPATLIAELADDLGEMTPAWAPGLRLFDWPGVRSGLIAYEPVSARDERGAYLVVRQARGWADAAGETPSLVRDLMVVRGQPEASDPRDGRERRPVRDFGRYYSAFNSIVYKLDTATNAGDWHRLQGPPIGANADLRLDVEIVCPKLGTLVAQRPVRGLMSAHTKEGGQASVWKTLVLKILDWPDLAQLEAELEMFGAGGAAADDQVIDHLVRRGVIGLFPTEAQASALFLRLTALHDPERVRRRISELTADAADPRSALVEAWHELESSHIILPPAAQAPIAASEARSLFERYALGPDQVAAAILAQHAPAVSAG